jgi:hypothetical protein
VFLIFIRHFDATYVLDEYPHNDASPRVTSQAVRLTERANFGIPVTRRLFTSLSSKFSSGAFLHFVQQGVATRPYKPASLPVAALTRHTMSAREIHLTKNGDAETATFSVDTVPEKVAGPGEVVVKITTAPVNPADIFSIMGVCEFGVPMGFNVGLEWALRANG